MQEVTIMLLTQTHTPAKKKRAWYRYYLTCAGKSLEGQGTEEDTTGHRLALRCLIEALKRMTRPARITILSDCNYLLNGMNALDTWKAAGFRRADGTKLRNMDLWEEIWRLKEGHEIEARYENTFLYK